ncbi:MAG: VCBS repeat-containing protein [Flavobacteriales bacterium]|nr:VCBS repeat-containing protein [Flavobacteriales bacterium]MCB9193205.1 VCBS repeat-containing protein [Flavobacteriales bacterium]
MMHPFGMVIPYSYDLYAPFCQLVDIDGDSDLDLFTADYNDSSIRFQPNIGTAQNPSFGSIVNDPFGLDATSFGQNTSRQSLLPVFADLDGDGDQDLLILAEDTTVYDMSYFIYVENIGSAMSPAFGNEQTDPFGLAPITIYEFGGQPSLVDLDGDGDLDLVISQYNDDTYHTDMIYYENIGSAMNPSFGPSVLDPFGLSLGNIATDAHAFIDLDADGDEDLLLAGYDSLAYFQNVGTAQAPFFQAHAALPGLTDPNIGQTEYLSVADLDGDGDLDILLGIYDDGDYVYWEQAGSVSIEEHDRPSDLMLTPVPFTNEVTIAMAQGHDYDMLLIQDVSGRELERIPVNGRTQVRWNASMLAPGLYLCTAIGGSRTTLAMVKE